jgi:hypothetical protein
MAGIIVRCPQQCPNLQVLQSKCLRIKKNANFYVDNRQIHEDFGIPFFTNHIRALTESLDSKFSDPGNTVVRQLGRHLLLPKIVWSPSLSNEEEGCRAGHTRPPLQGSQDDTTCSTQHCSATPAEYYRAFPQLWDKYQGINEKGHDQPTRSYGGLQPKWSPSSAAKDFSQSEPNSGFNSQTSIQPSHKLVVGIIPHQ